MRGWRLIPAASSGPGAGRDRSSPGRQHGRLGGLERHPGRDAGGQCDEPRRRRIPTGRRRTIRRAARPRRPGRGLSARRTRGSGHAASSGPCPAERGTGRNNLIRLRPSCWLGRGGNRARRARPRRGSVRSPFPASPPPRTARRLPARTGARPWRPKIRSGSCCGRGG